MICLCEVGRGRGQVRGIEEVGGASSPHTHISEMIDILVWDGGRGGGQLHGMEEVEEVHIHPTLASLVTYGL